jgi:hypothetical protein
VIQSISSRRERGIRPTIRPIHIIICGQDTHSQLRRRFNYVTVRSLDRNTCQAMSRVKKVGHRALAEASAGCSLPYTAKIRASRDASACHGWLSSALGSFASAFSEGFGLFFPLATVISLSLPTILACSSFDFRPHPDGPIVSFPHFGGQGLRAIRMTKT